MAKCIMFKQAYKLGEDLIGIMDFVEGTVPCVQVNSPAFLVRCPCFKACLYEFTGRAIALNTASVLGLLKSLGYSFYQSISLEHVDESFCRYWFEVLCYTILTQLNDIEFRSRSWTSKLDLYVPNSFSGKVQFMPALLSCDSY